ncbi:DUF6225 family protein [Streptomyces atratus]
MTDVFDHAPQVWNAAQLRDARSGAMSGGVWARKSLAVPFWRIRPA